jgi:hypothetical protein
MSTLPDGDSQVVMALLDLGKKSTASNSTSHTPSQPPVHTTPPVIHSTVGSVSSSQTTSSPAADDSDARYAASVSQYKNKFLRCPEDLGSVIEHYWTEHEYSFNNQRYHLHTGDLARVNRFTTDLVFLARIKWRNHTEEVIYFWNRIGEYVNFLFGKLLLIFFFLLQCSPHHSTGCFHVGA